MLIEWYGHSCFKLSTTEYSLVLDPYNPKMITGMVDYLLEADAVHCSHEHGDHNFRQAVKLSGKPDKGIFKINTISTFHDEEKGNKRGKNLITIIEADGFRLAHLGDLGCMLDEAQYKQLEGLDAIMIPVGGFYTIDAVQAKKICDRIKPRIIIPMHYKGKDFGPPPIATLDVFTSMYPVDFIRNYDTNRFEINAKTENQLVVMKYR